MITIRRPAAGPLLVMVAGVLWGTSGTAQALGEAVGSPLGLGADRLIVSGVVFVALAWRRRHEIRAHLHNRNVRWLAVLALVCVAGYQPAFFYGVRATGVVIGTLTAIGSAPLFAGLIAVALRSWPARRWYAATSVVLVGLFLLLLPDRTIQLHLAGVVCGLAAGLAYALYTWSSRRLLADGREPSSRESCPSTTAESKASTKPSSPWLPRG